MRHRQICRNPAEILKAFYKFELKGAENIQKEKILLGLSGFDRQEKKAEKTVLMKTWAISYGKESCFRGRIPEGGLKNHKKS